MKKLLFSVSLCLLSVFCAGAQNREVLEDSVIVCGISRGVVDMVLSADAGTQVDNSEKIFQQWVYSEVMKEISREHLSVFSDSELREIMDYYRSEGGRYVNSTTFIKQFASNITKSLMYELGADDEFSYSLNDTGYGSGLKETYQQALLSVSQMIDDMLGEDGTFQTNARNSGLSDSELKQVKDAITRCVEHFYDIYLLSFVDYLSKDALAEIEDFYLSPTGEKYAVYTQKVSNISNSMSEDFILDFNNRILAKDLTQVRTAVMDYVSLSRSIPEFFPDLYRPYAELTLGKNKYEGQTRDLLPHGKGKLTNKKGVVYEGDFKNGKRHGIIEVKVPGKEPVLQFWINDKYCAKIPAEGKGENSIPQVMEYDGKLFGYGQHYDIYTGNEYRGVFIDGQMNGVGQIHSSDIVGIGDFINGSLVNGFVVWPSMDWKVNEFKGKMSEEIWMGIRTLITNDESQKRVMTGTFLNGQLEGRGRMAEITEEGKYEIAGLFAFGEMYGEGEMKYQYVTADHGVKGVESYKGGFYANKYQGEGMLIVSLTDIPPGPWTFTRAHVRLPEVVTDSLVIVMDGEFDDGVFKKGRISCTDGTWYEGIFSKKGLEEGRMKRTYSDGSVYEGECSNGVINGKGVVRYFDGTVYEGEFVNGSPKGYKSQLPDDDNVSIEKKSESKTRNYYYAATSLSSGQARKISPAGVIFLIRVPSELDVVCKGVFDGEVLSEGRASVSDGSWLEGSFEDGVLIRGRGRTTDKYGTIYEGDIKLGFPHGNGKCTYSDGTYFKGKFANGNRMGGTHYTADGKVLKVYK